MKFLGILLFIVFFLSACWGKKAPQVWNQYEITIQRSDIADAADTVTFKNKKTGLTALLYTASFRILESKPLILNNVPVYSILSHSGGESGGFLTQTLVAEDQGKLRTLVMPEISGYNHADYLDVNQDGKTEIMIRSEKFSGFSASFDGKSLLLTRPLYEGSISVLPEIYTILYSEKGYEIVEVTFLPEFRQFITSEVDRALTEIEKIRGKTVSLSGLNDVDLNPLISAYFYLKKLNMSEKAQKMLEDAEITVKIEGHPGVRLSELIRDAKILN